MSLDNDLRALVRDHPNPRSGQRHIGASEAGHPCQRKLAYKLTGTPELNQGDPWAAYVGTSVHAQLEKAATADNDRLGRTRWLIEHKVNVYDDITGTVDLYDVDTQTVIDHKILGVDTLRGIKTVGPSDTYKFQVLMYALGLQRAGYDVRNVAIAAWPRSGRLSGLYLWTMPADLWHLDPILERYDAVKNAVHAGVPLALIPTTPSTCIWCPWFTPNPQITSAIK